MTSHSALRLVNTGAGWRWCYYSYLIMMSAATVMQYFFYNPPGFHQLHGGQRTVMQEVKRIDFVGTFLISAGLCMFLLGITWGEFLPWNPLYTANLNFRWFTLSMDIANGSGHDYFRRSRPGSLYLLGYDTPPHLMHVSRS
jgi:hypothetical protein